MAEFRAPWTSAAPLLLLLEKKNKKEYKRSKRVHYQGDYGAKFGPRSDLSQRGGGYPGQNRNQNSRVIAGSD